QENGLSRGTDARPGTRRLKLHERDETVNFRFLRRELRQYSAQAERVLAESRPHPVITGGGGGTLVENEGDHLENRGKTGRDIGPTRNLEGDMSVGEHSLGAHDPLGDSRLGDEKGASDLVCRQTTEKAERERHARLGGKDGMAGGENEAQQIIADVVVDLRLELL